MAQLGFFDADRRLEVLTAKGDPLQALYNLSDEETEFQINDRMTFMRFVGKGLEGRIPDALRDPMGRACHSICRQPDASRWAGIHGPCGTPSPSNQRRTGGSYAGQRSPGQTT